MNMWICKKCGYKPKEHPINPTDGYCPECKQYHMLIRFDPLYDNE